MKSYNTFLTEDTRFGQKEYSYDYALKKLKSGEWESSYDLQKGKSLEVKIWNTEGTKAKKVTVYITESINEEKLTKDSVKSKLKALGISFKYNSEWNEYVVNFDRGKETTAYYTDDLQDALDTGIAMSKEK